MSSPDYVFTDPAIEQQRLLLHAQLVREALRAYAPQFVPKRPARILDLGCNTGNLSVALREVFPDAEIVGIDRNAGAIDSARGQSGLQNATFVVGDIQEGLPPGPFDLVYASAILCHLPKLEHVIDLVYAALAPGGTFWMHEPHQDWGLDRSNQPDLRYLAEHFIEAMQKLGGRPLVCAELPTLLPAAGFTDMKIQDEVYPMGGQTLEGETILMSWFVGVRTAVKMLSQMTGSPEEEILDHAQALYTTSMTSAEVVAYTVIRNIVVQKPAGALPTN